METRRRIRPIGLEVAEEATPGVSYYGTRRPISAEALDDSLRSVLSERTTTVRGRSLAGVHPLVRVDKVGRFDDVKPWHISSRGVVEFVDGLEYVSMELLRGNREVKKVILPKTVKSIGRSAFEGCTSLEEIELPAGLREIGTCAFKGCTNLKEVFIPGTVRTIGECAFYGCTALCDLQMAPGVRTLEKLCFGNCSSLRNFRKRDLPSSVDNTVFADGAWKSTWDACFAGSPCARSLFGRK